MSLQQASLALSAYVCVMALSLLLLLAERNVDARKNNYAISD